MKSQSCDLTRWLVQKQAEVESFIQLGDIAHVDERLATVQDIELRIRGCEDLSELYRSREQIFNLPQTDYPQLDQVRLLYEVWTKSMLTSILRP